MNSLNLSTSLLPFVTYEDADIPVTHLVGKVLIEDVMVTYPQLDEPQAMKRYTLYPVDGTEIQLSKGVQKHDEGWSREVITIEQDWFEDRDGNEFPIWKLTYESDGRDCDGRVDSGAEFYSQGDTDPDAYDHKPDASKCVAQKSYQRDYAAEAAGY